MHRGGRVRYVARSWRLGGLAPHAGATIAGNNLTCRRGCPSSSSCSPNSRDVAAQGGVVYSGPGPQRTECTMRAGGAIQGGFFRTSCHTAKAVRKRTSLRRPPSSSLMVFVGAAHRTRRGGRDTEICRPPISVRSSTAIACAASLSVVISMSAKPSGRPRSIMTCVVSAVPTVDYQEMGVCFSYIRAIILGSIRVSQ